MELPIINYLIFSDISLFQVVLAFEKKYLSLLALFENMSTIDCIIRLVKINGQFVIRIFYRPR